MDKVLSLRRCVDSMAVDAEKFFLKKNKSAGIRTRKKLQKCKKLSQDIRKKIQFIKLNINQKKAKIKAYRAALFGQSVLTTQSFKFKCLKENQTKAPNLKINEYTGVQKEEKSPELTTSISKSYDFNDFSIFKEVPPIPFYSIFNYENIQNF